MKPSIQAITAFVKTASLGSFAAAAKELDQTSAAVSKQVKSLEQQLETRLLHRTTRKLSLTEEGEYLYHRYGSALAQIDDSYNWLETRRQHPTGKLRVSMPHNLGRHLVLPLLPEFKQRYPHIEPELYFDDFIKDPVAYGFDVGIRGGTLSESGLVARKLTSMKFYLCATPEYLAAHAPITEPADLLKHEQIRFRIAGHANVQDWVLTKRNESILVDSNTALTVNNQGASFDAIMMNMGIGFLETYYCQPEIDKGKLIRVLPEYHYGNNDRSYYLYYPNRENLAPKVRVFIDFLVEQLGS